MVRLIMVKVKDIMIVVSDIGKGKRDYDSSKWYTDLVLALFMR